jgi:hypothetical protein
MNIKKSLFFVEFKVIEDVKEREIVLILIDLIS